MSRIISLLLVSVGALIITLLTPRNVRASSRSKTVTVNYQTTYRGKRYSKQALVYLPAGYSSQQKYNVIYLLHGSTETARDFYRDGDFQQLLDRLIANGQLKPSIVVFPTYYPDRSFVTSDYYRDNRLNRAFAQHELVADLIPKIEGRYSTYAKSTTQEALRSSRQHRAFGGFSMGAITSWYVFQYQLPYFSTYLPVAGDSWTVEDDGGAMAPRETAIKLYAAEQQNIGLPFHILAGVGSADSTAGSMTPQIKAMRKLAAFNHQNLQYYRAPGGTHSPQTAAHVFRHYAPQLFN